MKTQHLLENVRVAAGENDGIGFQRPSLTYHTFMWGRVQHWPAELDKNSRYRSQPQVRCFNSGAISTSARFVHVTLTQYDTQPKAHYHLYRTLLLLIWVLQIPPGQNFDENKAGFKNKNAEAKLEDKCVGLPGHLMHEIIWRMNHNSAHLRTNWSQYLQGHS
jgi:hypothetical protein